MGAQQRVYRQRIRSVQATKKISSAMELIAASRIVKARQRVAASTPYARAITRAVSAVATYSNVEHPLITEKDEVRRAAVLLITSDRGMAGAYSSTVLKAGEQLAEQLRAEGKEVVPYVVGRKGGGLLPVPPARVRRRVDRLLRQPRLRRARRSATRIIADFLTGYDEGGVDEIHVVYTHFVNMVTQVPEVIRLLPLEVVEGEEAPAPDEVLPLYEFEPNAEPVLDALLPKYVSSRLFNGCCRRPPPSWPPASAR